LISSTFHDEVNVRLDGSSRLTYPFSYARNRQRQGGCLRPLRHSRSRAAQQLSTAARHLLVHAPNLRYQRFEHAKISALGPVKPYCGPATGYFALRFLHARWMITYMLRPQRERSPQSPQPQAAGFEFIMKQELQHLAARSLLAKPI
jgi:hypothetical protein